MMTNTISPLVGRMAALALARGGKGFRTPSRADLRAGRRSIRGQRREAIREATCDVVVAQQLVSAGVSPAGAMLIQAKRRLAAARAS